MNFEIRVSRSVKAKILGRGVSPSVMADALEKLLNDLSADPESKVRYLADYNRWQYSFRIDAVFFYFFVKIDKDKNVIEIRSCDLVRS